MKMLVKLIELYSFTERWLEKTKVYKSYRDLNDYFDLYFSLYVVYNRIYNAITFYQLDRGDVDKMIDEGILPKDQRGDVKDKFSSTACVAYFLKNEIRDIIKESSTEIEIFKIIITEKRFHIVFQKGVHQPNEDKKLLEGLSSTEPFVAVKSLLLFLYHIRCNIFHGEKGFDIRQREILGAANSSLEKLINRLKPKLNEISIQLEEKLSSNM